MVESLIALRKLRCRSNQTICKLVDRIQQLELEKARLIRINHWNLFENGLEDDHEIRIGRLASEMIAQESASLREQLQQIESKHLELLQSFEETSEKLRIRQEDFCRLEADYQKLSEEFDRLRDYRQKTLNTSARKSYSSTLETIENGDQLLDQINKMRQFISQAASTSSQATINIVDAYNAALVEIETLQQKISSLVEERDAWKQNTRRLEREIMDATQDKVAVVDETRAKRCFPCPYCQNQSPIIII